MMRMIGIIAVIVLTAIAGYAQQDEPAASGAPSGAGPAAGTGDMMAMMGMMHPGIAVDGEYVYIVRGDQVIKLSKTDFRVILTATLPPAPKMNMSSGGMSGSGPMTSRPDMQQKMQQMSMMQPSQFEQSFLENMIRHHQGAVEMSQLALIRAVHPELRRFAQNVITGQIREQNQFAQWLKTWYKAPAVKQLTGIDAQMVSNLRNLTGRDFEIRYMQEMITHHAEAVQMGTSAEQKAVHSEVKAAAANIVKQQSSEITELRGWLASWYGVR